MSKKTSFKQIVLTQIFFEVFEFLQNVSSKQLSYHVGMQRKFENL
jgi:hypothetical protein